MTIHGSMIGPLSCLVACLGFGSCYLPAKRVDIRDGQAFSLFLSMGILAVGLTQWLLCGRYEYELFAMLGGMIWATGNLAVPFIVRRCGLGVGQLVWSSTNMLTGWATGTFGLFGKTPEQVGSPILNYLGVALAVVPLFLFAMMDRTDEAEAAERKPLAAASQSLQRAEGGRPFLEGFLTALAAGVLFGANFCPPTYLQEQGLADVAAGLPPRHSIHPTDYVLPHFCGVFLTTLAAFAAGRLASPASSRDLLSASREVAWPGLAAGVMWGVAQVAWFQANSTLSYVVSFPIIVGVPGIIVALWGTLLFGENRGTWNRTLLGLAILVQAASLLLIVRSRSHVAV